MTRFFQFPPLSPLPPMALSQLAQSIATPQPPSDIPQLNAPPRSFDRLLDAILNSESLTRLEWAYCLYAKAEWQRQHPRKCLSASAAIWKLARRHPGLKHRLFWHLASDLGGTGAIVLPAYFAETFSIFMLQGDRDCLAVTILKLLTLDEEQAAYELAKLSLQYLLTPRELLGRAQLPPNLAIARLAFTQVSRLLPSAQPNAQQVEWVLRCLDCAVASDRDEAI